jgi:hypothetical protein
LETDTTPSTDPWSRSASEVMRASLVNDLKTTGYSVVHGAITDDGADAILSSLELNEIAINTSTLKSVRQGTLRFFPNVIAKSKLAYNIVVSDLILDLCQQYLDCDFILANNRIVSAHEEMYMPWHTDNNLMDGEQFIGKHPLQGVQFVLYLTDTGQSPFQLIRNSQAWSLDWPTRYLDNVTAQRQFSDQLVEIRPRKGTLLALNTHIFHRGVGFREKNFSRTLLLFQFDQASADHPGHGEKLYLDPAFIDNYNPTLARILGFGNSRTFSTFPFTSIRDLPVASCVDLEGKLFSIILSRFSLSTLRRLLPERLVVLIKNMLSRTR